MKPQLPAKTIVQNIVKQSIAALMLIMLVTAPALKAFAGDVLNKKSISSVPVKTPAHQNKAIKPALAAPPVLSYSSGAKTYTVGTAITPLTPTSSGVSSGHTYAGPVNYGSGFVHPYGVAIDAAGNLYEADNYTSTIKKVTPAGVVSNIGTGGTVGFKDPTGVAVDMAGNVYVADDDHDSVEVIPLGGATATPIVIGAGFNGPQGVAVDAAGDLFIADGFTHTIKKITSPSTANKNSMVTVVVPSTLLKGPTGVAVDAAGNIYVADATQNPNAILKFSSSGAYLGTVGSGFSFVAGVAIDAQGNVFVADRYNNATKMVTPAGDIFTVVTGTSIVTGVAVDNKGVVYTAAEGQNMVLQSMPSSGYFISPALPPGLSFNTATGSISGTPTTVTAATDYTVTAYNASGGTSAVINIKTIMPPPPAIDYGANKIYFIDKPIPTLLPTSSGVNAPAYKAPAPVAAGYKLPMGIAAGPDGRVYVADLNNNTIDVLIGDNASAIGGTTTFKTPYAVAVDADNNVYVADYGNSKIEKILPNGTVQLMLLGYQASGIAVDAAKNIYFSDANSSQVRKLTTTGALLNLGPGGTPGGLWMDDNTGYLYEANASGNIQKFLTLLTNQAAIPVVTTGLTQPTDVKFDAAGNMYVADYGSNTVKMYARGTTTNPVQVGPVFNGPQSIAIDGKGNIYVSEHLANLVKRIVPAGGYYSNGLPPGLNLDNSTGAITGTPTKLSDAKDYSITAYNDHGGFPATLNIAIQKTPVVISYNATNVFSVNTMVTPLAPVSSGVNAFAYSAVTSQVSNTTDFQRPTGITSVAAGNVYVVDNYNSYVVEYPADGSPAIRIPSTLNSAGDIAADAAGNLYIIERSSNTGNGLKKILASDHSTVLLRSGFGNPNGLALDAAGNIYVTDLLYQSVTKYDKNGANPQAVGSGWNGPFGIKVDAGGTIYVSEYGKPGIKELPAGATTPTVVPMGLTQATGLTLDAGGNVYVCDYTKNKIFMLPSDNSPVVTLGDGLTGPNGVTIAPNGNLYLADYTNGLIKMIKPIGGYFLNSYLPNGLYFDNKTGNITGTPTAVSDAKNYRVTGYNTADSSSAVFSIKVGAQGGIAPHITYPAAPTNISQGSTVSISPVNSGGGIGAFTYGEVTTLAGGGTGTATNGHTTAASFKNPFAIARSIGGQLYVADYNNNIIRQIDAAGNVTTLAGSGVAGYADGSGTAAMFHSPSGIAVDAQGYIYVADAGNQRIRKISPAGDVTTFAGSAAGTIDGQGTSARFHLPRGLAFDNNGNLYVADYSNNEIRKITPAGLVSTFAGNVTAGNADGTGGTGGTARFSGPFALDFDKDGNMYVADYGNNLIRKITPGKTVTTFAGGGSAATFNGPSGIAVDGIGNVFVADAGSNLIRKITPSKVMTTLTGSGAAGSLNGIGAAATFNSPHGLVISNDDIIYVADYTGSLIRAVNKVGYSISPALPGNLSFDGTTGIISGIASELSPATTYTISGYNRYGSSTVTLSIAVTGIQAPHITYTNHTYNKGDAVNISPANSGGAVPATIYSTVTTLAGGGTGTATNGTGAQASFKNPFAIATGPDGTMYVADYNNNIIRKVTPGGVVSTFAGSGVAGYGDYNGIHAIFHSPAGIAVDAAGYVYVADAGNQRIRKISPTGDVTTFAGSGAAGSTNGAATVARFHLPRGLVFDTAGNLYVADYSNNEIRMITPDGTVSTFAGSSTGVAGTTNSTGGGARFTGPFALDLDKDGNMYVADYGNNLIRKITPARLVSTFAGATGATFNGPSGIAVDVSGNVYVADAGNNQIRKITPAKVVTTLAGNTTAGTVNNVGTAAGFSAPHGLTIDNAGNIYVADYTNNLLRKIVTSGYTLDGTLPTGLSFDGTTGIISGTATNSAPSTAYTITAYNSGGSSTSTFNLTVTGPPPPSITYNSPAVYTVNDAVNLTPTNTGSLVPANIYGQVSTLAGGGTGTATNGTGTLASFKNPIAIATATNGTLYVADYSNNIIRKVTPGGVVTTFAGSGVAGYADGHTTAAMFHSPTGIAVDAFGNVYVSDAGNQRIRKITPVGDVTTFAGTGAAGAANGAGLTAAKFHVPRGLAFDVAGNLYVADYSSNMIRKITPAAVVSTFAGNATAGSADGTGTAAGFSGPFALAFDSDGNLYVTDSGNQTVRAITPAGVVTTFAGTAGAVGHSNATGAAASFSTPYGIAIDGADNLYVSEGTNDMIRKINPARLVTTLAGSTTGGSTNAVGVAAKFDSPHGLAIDAATGNIYVADYNNNLIRKITPTGYTIDNTLPGGLTFDGTTGAITGTATSQSSAANYVISAYNNNGKDVFTLSLTISAVVKPMKAMTTNSITNDAMTQPEVKPALSPNGDGINDVLIISNIEKYPNNRLTIIDATGNQVYQVSGYDNSSKIFDGHSGKTRVLQKPGTYFYQLDYTDDGKLKFKTGYIVIKY